LGQHDGRATQDASDHVGMHGLYHSQEEAISRSPHGPLDQAGYSQAEEKDAETHRGEPKVPIGLRQL
jgi:hypothetical protein